MQFKRKEELLPWLQAFMDVKIKNFSENDISSAHGIAMNES